jgi:hypothetical protein
VPSDGIARVLLWNMGLQSSHRVSKYDAFLSLDQNRPALDTRLRNLGDLLVNLAAASSVLAIGTLIIERCILVCDDYFALAALCSCLFE